jgi:hypothetical protein
VLNNTNLFRFYFNSIDSVFAYHIITLNDRVLLRLPIPKQIIRLGDILGRVPDFLDSLLSYYFISNYCCLKSTCNQ